MAGAGGRLAASTAAARAVFAHPKLRRAMDAFTLAVTADLAFAVGLAVVAFRDGGAAGVGLVAVLRMLPSAIGTPMLVSFADRLPRDRLLAVVSLTRAVTIGGAAVLLALDVAIVGVYVLSVVASIAFNLFRPTHSALLPALCKTTAELTSANVVRGVVESVATLFGPIIAGVLLAVGEPSLVFAVAAGLSAAAAVSVGRLGKDPMTRAPAEQRPQLLGEAIDGVRAVATNRDLRLVVGAAFAQTFVRGALNVYTVVIAIELLDAGEPAVGFLGAAIGVGALVGSVATSLLVGSRRLGRWLAIGLALWGTPIALIAVVPELAAACLLLAAVGLANAIIDIPIFTVPVRLASDAVLGRVFGVLESLIALGVALGSAVAPLLIALLGLRPALVATGALLPGLAVLVWPRLADLDRRLAVRDGEIEALRAAPVFAASPVPVIEHLAQRLHRQLVAASRFVFHQGDRGSSFYVIVHGEVDIVGNGVLLCRLGPGDSFGEIAPLDDVPRTAAARAHTDLLLLRIGRTAFLGALAGHSGTQQAVRAVAAEHLATLRPSGPTPAALPVP